MNNIKNNPWLITLPRIVLVVFILFNIIAMLAYPGSTYQDNISPGYSFTQNFLSDLYFHVRKVFSENNQRILSLFGSIFGVLGGLCLVGVGFTPADLYLDIHIICSTWLFRFFFVASFCYSIVIFRHIKFENKYAS